MRTTKANPGTFTKEQLAAKALVSYRTIDRAIANGDLAIIKVGRLVRISAEDAERFLRSRTCPENAA